MRPQCQWHGRENQHPRAGGSAPLLWCDWSRREQRQACMQVVRHQQVNVEEAVGPRVRLPAQPAVLSRVQRAHYRLSWQERLARNARTEAVAQFTLKLFGIPDHFAAFLEVKAK